MTEDEMVGWHHRLHGHEFGQPPGDGEGQGSPACCSPWGHKESDTTEPQNNQVGNDCTAQGAQPVLCDAQRGGGRGYVYTHSWFSLLDSGNQHNIAKQLYSK